MISKEQYGEWRQHPATQFFLKFLRDRKNDLTNQAFEMFIRGVFNDATHVHRGQILELTLLEEASFSDIQAFYEENNGSAEVESHQQGQN